MHCVIQDEALNSLSVLFGSHGHQINPCGAVQPTLLLHPAALYIKGLQCGSLFRSAVGIRAFITH